MRKAFGAASVVWAAALPLAAVAASRPSAASFGAGYPFAFLAYAIGSLVCHQRPERSFQLLAVQLPVCARCTGIYVGAAVVSVAMAVGKAKALHYTNPETQATRLPETPVTGVVQSFSFARDPRAMLLVSALPTIATLVVEWTAGQVPGNWVRAISGAPLGAAVAWIVCRRVN